MVNQRQGRAEKRRSGGRVFCLKRPPELADLVPQARGVSAIALRPLASLLDALQG